VIIATVAPLLIFLAIIGELTVAVEALIYVFNISWSNTGLYIFLVYGYLAAPLSRNSAIEVSNAALVVVFTILVSLLIVGRLIYVRRCFGTSWVISLSARTLPI
jgi:hypothetical protein